MSSLNRIILISDSNNKLRNQPQSFYNMGDDAGISYDITNRGLLHIQINVQQSFPILHILFLSRNPISISYPVWIIAALCLINGTE